ncbi:cobalamin binding intrinsic factor-like [Lepisosteus oculatus]|uniref:Gastric intrinsic factor-like n=1 Tax=Lepisosteus oculatus TaxID=7918 RepID=W5M890_LEPOC|nr:PREDICTED: gastric intrinsic factor-like [Lepisosteus oculatus]
MALAVTMILSTVLLLVPALLVQPESSGWSPILLSVRNAIDQKAPLSFRGSVPYRGSLLGAMWRIQQANSNFSFETRDDINYGPYLVSVNGVAGNDTAHTYWQLLRYPKTPLDRGVGCYIPKPNEHIILNFTTWDNLKRH